MNKTNLGLKAFISIIFVILSVQFSYGQSFTCHDINFPTLNSSLYQGVYYSELKWENKKTLTVSFHNGTQFLQNQVKKYAPLWSAYTNIKYEFVTNKDADIRIGFYQGKGSWSLIGKQAASSSVDISTGNSIGGRNGISMNFGWFDEKTSEAEFKRTILHEFGHSLSLLHEHKNPASGIKWNYPKVYAYYMQTQNWTKEQVDNNVLKKYSVSQTNNTYDPRSIMHYPVSKEFTLDGFAVGYNYELSEGDKKLAASIYPAQAPKPSNSKYRITNLVFGDGVWALTMSKLKSDLPQAWRTRTNYPDKEIKELWDKGYHITNLTFGNGLWALVMTKGMNYQGQTWRTNKAFPKDEINEFWNKGYHLTSLEYGNDLWSAVMTKGVKFTAQTWRTNKSFPKDEIKEFWDKGYHITSLTYGNGIWALVMSKGTNFTAQQWRTRDHFPKDEIKELWDKGFQITNLSYGNGIWALVMTKGLGSSTQSWRTRNNFPEKEINELWN